MRGNDICETFGYSEIHGTAPIIQLFTRCGDYDQYTDHDSSTSTNNLNQLDLHWHNIITHTKSTGMHALI